MLSRRELLFLVALFIASLPAVTARIYSSDEVEYFSYLRSLWFDHDVSFENEYRYFYDHRIAQTPDFHQTFLELQTSTGRRINYGTIGCAMLWAPFYGVADVATRVMRAMGRTVEVDGYAQPYLSAVAYGSAFYGFAAVVIAIAVARRMVGKYETSSGVIVWLGTPLLFYMYVAPPFSHACSAFAVALFVAVWLKVRETWSVRGIVVLALAAALMAMVREQDILCALGPAVDFALERNQRPQRKLMAAAVGAAAFLIGYLPQLIAYQALNGFPRPSPLVTRKMFWYSPHALQVLLDPEHGFFFWTPLALLAVAGLILLVAVARSVIGEEAETGDDRQIAGCMLLMVAMQVYVSGAVESWTVAGAFGQRRFVAVTIFLVIGLAAFRRWVAFRGARLAANIAVALCVWWNLALTLEFGTSMMDRQKLELRRNAYDAFVTLPRTAPKLLYRYFTNRSSFYKPAASD
ncbi:MAG TPA: hypothetical protein VL882_18365 [Vicinamibacterales bacterium]|jgi:hypothetical protein|nr:hypothetical protein [Vicinamibacterales bacterium]